MRLPCAALAFALACCTAAAAPPSATRPHGQAEWMRQVMQHVQQNWLRPPGTGAVACDVEVEQQRDGRVIGVQLPQGCGSEALDQSIRRAIERSSPLPAAPSDAAFEARIRFRFTHDPQ